MRRFEGALRAYWSATKTPMIMALLLSGFILIVSLFRKDGANNDGELPIAVIVGLYLVFALLAGLVIAIGGSWASTRLRGGVLGSLAGALAALAFQLLVAWPILRDPLSPFQLILFMATMGLVLGFPLGALHWSKPESSAGNERR